MSLSFFVGISFGGVILKLQGETKGNGAPRFCWSFWGGGFPKLPDGSMCE